MTQERLRELLRERVAHETMPDYSERAWQAARVVRRRHRLGVAAGVVVATVGISGGIAIVDSTAPRPPAPAVPLTDHEQPDATYQGVPVWWSPDQYEEQQLPTVDSPLPAEINLGEVGGPHTNQPVGSAVAAFGRGTSLALVGPDGAIRWVDLSQLQEIATPDGDRRPPTSTGMLSPTGAYLAFVQPGHVALYDVSSGAWSEVDASGGAIDMTTGSGVMLTWVAADEFVVSGAPLGGLGDRYDVTGRQLAGVRVGPFEPAFDWRPAQPSGGDVRSPHHHYDAQSYGRGVPLPLQDPETERVRPGFMAVPGSVLAFTFVASYQNQRYEPCCQVAGWLDDDTVVYESHGDNSSLVAWRVGTHDFGSVAHIYGLYDVASFAF